MNIYFLNKILNYYEIGIITLKYNQIPNYFTYVIMYLCIFNFLFFSIRNFIFILIDLNFILKIAKNIFFSNFIINRYNSNGIILGIIIEIQIVLIIIFIHFLKI